MYDFRADSDCPKPELYRQLRDSALALTEGEPDGIANMANDAALICEYLPDLNWAGIYRLAQ
jgi:GAF domain-containing protein